MKKKHTLEKELKYIFSKSPAFFMKKISKKNPMFDFEKPVVIFGAAKMGKVFFDLCRKNNLTILTYCDNNAVKHGKHFEGLPLVSVETLCSNYSRDVQIIVASMQDDAIIPQLKGLGFKKIWSYSYFFTIFADRFHALVHTSNYRDIFTSKEEILRVFYKLEDDNSRLVYVNTLMYRLTLDKKYLQEIKESSKDAYFDENIVTLSKNEVLIDGGAYDGDTLESFIHTTKGIYRHVICFEPDSKSFDRLRAFAKRDKNKSRITCLKYGLGEKKKIVRFSDEGNLQSSVNNVGSTQVRIVTVDDYIYQKPTLIKMDIEGYEKQALLGSKKTIKKLKPKLAICAYHYQEDLWKIPLYMLSLNSNYKIYFRHYHQDLFETICYGV